MSDISTVELKRVQDALVMARAIIILLAGIPVPTSIAGALAELDEAIGTIDAALPVPKE